MLAQKVLLGATCGYKHHPQLLRFRNSPSPLESIAAYLHGVQAEATRRHYRFDAGKIAAAGQVAPLEATQGQIDYEWQHLQAKLRMRDPQWLAGFAALARPEAHPLFRIVPGAIADWEVIQAGQSRR